MKRIIIVLATSISLCSTHAQLLSPESVHGAVWGGIIGGIVGGDRHHGFSGNGAAIGAGVGLLAGSLASGSRHYSYHDEPIGHRSFAPTISLGYGYGYHRSSAYVYHTPNNYLAPGYYYQPSRPNYAVSGTILGATSGALIGAGNHDAGRGALIGAAAGLALGSVAEHSIRREERAEQRAIAVQARQQNETSQLQQISEPKPLRLLPAPQITSTPVSTSTYFWTPRPQIRNSPTVSDAPTF